MLSGGGAAAVRLLRLPLLPSTLDVHPEPNGDRSAPVAGPWRRWPGITHGPAPSLRGRWVGTWAGWGGVQLWPARGSPLFPHGRGPLASRLNQQFRDEPSHRRLLARAASAKSAATQSAVVGGFCTRLIR